MDVDSIHPGIDFHEKLKTTLLKSTVTLVIIGNRWLSVTDSKGNRRIDAQDDFVRQEIETALINGIHTIPLLVENTSMPKREELPNSISALANRQAIHFRAAPYFNGDLDRITTAISEHFTSLGHRFPLSKKQFPSLQKFKLEYPDNTDFGDSQISEALSHTNGFSSPTVPAKNTVIFLAEPTEDLGSADFLQTSAKVLGNWFDSQSGPKYFSPQIFQPPMQRRASHGLFIWEDNANQDLKLHRLLASRPGEVAYGSSQRFLRYVDDTPIFRAGTIFAELWKFSTLASQLYFEVGYLDQVNLCLAMTNTRGSHLGDLADQWLEPYGNDYWRDVAFSRIDLTTHSTNLVFTTKFMVSQIQDKIQPAFISKFSDEISQAYNQDKPRFLEKATGQIPDKYF